MKKHYKHTLQLEEVTMNAILYAVEQTPDPRDLLDDPASCLIGPYTLTQVWLTLEQKVQSLPQCLSLGSNCFVVSKSFSAHGTARFFLAASPTSCPPYLLLETVERGYFQVNAALPLASLHKLSGTCHFHDFRIQHLQSIAAMQRHGSTPEALAWMWLGMRWVCRNLREWEQPGVVWPEDIDETASRQGQGLVSIW